MRRIIIRSTGKSTAIRRRIFNDRNNMEISIRHTYSEKKRFLNYFAHQICEIDLPSSPARTRTRGLSSPGVCITPFIVPFFRGDAAD